MNNLEFIMGVGIFCLICGACSLILNYAKNYKKTGNLFLDFWFEDEKPSHNV